MSRNNQLFDSSKPILQWHIQSLQHEHQEHLQQAAIHEHLLQISTTVPTSHMTDNHHIIVSDTASTMSSSSSASSSTFNSFRSAAAAPIRIHPQSPRTNPNISGGSQSDMMSSSSSSFSFSASSLSHMLEFGTAATTSSLSSSSFISHQRSNSLHFGSASSSNPSFNNRRQRSSHHHSISSAGSRKSVAVSKRSNAAAALQREDDGLFSAMIDDKLAGVEGYFLNGAFFIFEQSGEQELDSDDDTISEKLRFFHPQHTPLNSQLNFVSVLQGLITFAAGFRDRHDNVSLVTFSHSKLAIRSVGNLIFALSMSNTVPDNAIRRKLEHIIDTVHFLHGPWDHVEEKCSTHSEYCAMVRHIGLELIPLVNYLTQSPASNFDPLPYTELPTVRSNDWHIILFFCNPSDLSACSAQSIMTYYYHREEMASLSQHHRFWKS